MIEVIFYSDACDILIPIHANVFFSTHDNKERDLYGGVLNGQTTEKIIDFIIKKGKKNNFYLDFCNIYSSDSRVFSKFSDLEGYNIIIINANVKLYGNISSEALNSKAVSTIKLVDTAPIALIDSIKFNHRADLFRSISKPDENYYLDSSNVYLNKYVNVKSLFNDIINFKLLLYELSNLIVAAYSNEKKVMFDYLVSSSSNGSAIAVCLSDIFNVPALYFHNIGPKYAMHNANIKDHIRHGKRYLYIYDFICLGTEYRLTKNIIESNSGNFIGGVGFSSYAKPKMKVKYKEEPLHVMNIESLAYIDRATAYEQLQHKSKKGKILL